MRDSALSSKVSVLSSSVIGCFKNGDHSGDLLLLLLTWHEILSFHARTAASSLLMQSRTLCSDFSFNELNMPSTELDCVVNALYSLSLKFALPDCH